MADSTSQEDVEERKKEEAQEEEEEAEEMSLPLNRVVLGDCVEVMRGWPADSIDLVVTSPPYWGLRDYGSETVLVWGGLPECEHEWGDSLPFTGNKRGNRPGDHSTSSLTNPERQDSLPRPSHSGNICSNCGAWRGSLGLEPHPQLFVNHLVEICREIKRVLKPSGTFWLNLGDTYYGSGGKGGQYEKFMPDKGQPDHYRQSSKARSNWLQPKQKLMIPARVAIALQHDGWILRSDVIWHKSNHMPDPAKDRLTNAYEHVFLFAKRGHYYFDLDAIRVPHAPVGRWGKGLPKGLDPLTHHGEGSDLFTKGYKGHPLGKNPGNVWRITPASFTGAHFATFPPKLIEPIIKAGSPKGGVVLDPFGGSGTVGQVARRLGRRFILIEVVPEYADMARQRVRGRYKPAPEGVTPFTQNIKEVK